MNKAGFTIIELLVVIAMIGVLSTIVVVQFGAGNADSALGNATTFVTTDIRGASTWAQGGRTCCDDAVPYGYGVVFTIDSSEYAVYADLDGDAAYSIGTDEVVRAVNLVQEGVSDVSVSACVPVDATNTYCDIHFDVPSAAVTATGDSTADVSITLTHADSGETEIIEVSNTTGQVQ